jgi:hypothetical protein
MINLGFLGFLLDRIIDCADLFPGTVRHLVLLTGAEIAFRLLLNLFLLAIVVKVEVWVSHAFERSPLIFLGEARVIPQIQSIRVFSISDSVFVVDGDFYDFGV